MILYIDKENVVSMVRDRKDPRSFGCSDFIRQNLSIHCNFTLDEAKKDDFLSFWLSDFATNVKGEIKFMPEVEEYPQRPLKSNFYNSNKQDLLSIFLLSDEHACEVIDNKKSILIGKPGQEFDKIESLYLRDTEVISKTIQKWSSYLAPLPLTDLIIADNHYFKNKRVYEANKNELIEYFSSIPNQSPLNVVIITSEKEKDVSFTDEMLEQECAEIKKMVKSKTDSKNSKVTILTTYKTHDRCIITNYYRVKHGSCFHLIDNGLKDDVTTEMKTHAVVNNWKNSEYLLDIYQSIADGPVKKYGDCESNLLKFV